MPLDLISFFQNNTPAALIHTNNQHRVRNEKVLRIPGKKTRIAVAEGYSHHPSEAEISGVRLKTTVIRQAAAIQTLCAACAIEADVGCGHYDIVNDQPASDETH